MWDGMAAAIHRMFSGMFRLMVPELTWTLSEEDLGRDYNDCSHKKCRSQIGLRP